MPAYRNQDAEAAADKGRQIRIHKRSAFDEATLIPNSTAQDAGLSWAARGFLAYCLSLPAGWRLNEAHLIRQAPSGREHLRTLVRELERAGYLRRTQGRDASGRHGVADWEVWDTPMAAATADGKPVHGQIPCADRVSTADGKPVDGKPVDGSPVGGKPVDIEETTSKKQEQVRKPPSTLRVEPPPAGGAAGGQAEQDQERQGAQQPAAEQPAAGDPREPSQPPLEGQLDERPDCGSGGEGSAAAARQRRRRAAGRPVQGPDDAVGPLPDFARPYRPLLAQWWRNRCKKHRHLQRDGLSIPSIRALEEAQAAGVLEAFCEQASEAAWQSLGWFVGGRSYRDLIAQLAADRERNAMAVQTGQGAVPSPAGHSGRFRFVNRSEQALHEYLAMVKSQESEIQTVEVQQCSPMNTSPTALSASASSLLPAAP